MDKILLVFICLISISNFCLVEAETIETWGELYNVRAVAEQSARARWILFVVRRRKLRFPTTGEYDTPIAAIQHVSYSNRAPTTEILSGGLNKTHVELEISSRRSYGITSTVTIFQKLVN